MRLISWRPQRRTFDKLAPMVLFGLMGWWCWRLASMIWWIIAPPQVPIVQPVVLGSQKQVLPDIVRFSLFEAPQPLNNPSITAPAPMPPVPIKLEGVMLSGRGSTAMLHVNERSDGYRVGQRLPGSDYRLTEVYWNRVVLRDSTGQRRVIKFGDPAIPVNPVTTPPDNAANNTSGSMTAPPTSMSPTGNPESFSGAPVATPPGNPSAAGGRPNALNQAISSLQTNRDQYLGQMGLTPGQNGLEISDRTPLSLRNRLGLRPGDRILSVNGQALGGSNEAQLLEQVRSSGQARIEIQRGQQTLTLQQSF